MNNLNIKINDDVSEDLLNRYETSGYVLQTRH